MTGETATVSSALVDSQPAGSAESQNEVTTPQTHWVTKTAAQPKNPKKTTTAMAAAR
jgi:hypothetical protein